MKAIARKALFHLAPQWATALLAARARAHSHRYLGRIGCEAVNRVLLERFGSKVQAGPFAGMELTPSTFTEQIGPYLLGTYESFLPWESVLSRSYSSVIDIGCKFGYYAVGIARRMPGAPVYAFDADRWARRATEEMKVANGTSNLTVLGYCTPGWLRNVAPGSLVICDIDGGEGELIPAAAQHLRSSTLVIETHDCFCPGITERVAARLKNHEVSRLRNTEPDVPFDLSFIPESQRHLAYREIRPDQEWLIATPSEHASES